MWRRNFISVILVFVYVSCEKDLKIGSRKARLFTFNTVNDDIRVDLDFSIPFISIPVKPTIDNVFGSIGIPSVNVNLPALVLGGGVVIASTFLLPLLFKTFSQQPPYDRYAKILEHTQFGAETVLDFTRNVLSGGMQGCTLRVACWSGQREHEDSAKFWTGVMKPIRCLTRNVLSGGVEGCTLRVTCCSGQREYEDSAKFWTKVMCNQLISTLVNSTSVEDAITSGRRGRNCSSYSPCPLTEEHFPIIMKNLMQLSNYVS